MSYVTETPSVTEYLTQDIGGSAALNKTWGSVRGALHYNSFQDQVPSLLFDSPFRTTDSLSATIGTGVAATALVFALSSRPADALQLNLRYRRYDLNNQTPRISFVNGVGNMDRTWSTSRQRAC